MDKEKKNVFSFKERTHATKKKEFFSSLSQREQ